MIMHSAALLPPPLPMLSQKYPVIQILQIFIQKHTVTAPARQLSCINTFTVHPWRHVLGAPVRISNAMHPARNMAASLALARPKGKLQCTVCRQGILHDDEQRLACLRLPCRLTMSQTI